MTARARGLAGPAALASSHLRATVHHAREQSGGPRRALALAIVLIAGLLGFGAVTYGALESLLGDLLNEPQVRQAILPVLPVVLTFPSFALSLVVCMVMPLASPLTLQARIAGVSRWMCAVAEFVPFALLTVLLTLLCQSGSIGFLSRITATHVSALTALILMNATLSLSCLLLVSLIQRALSLARVPAFESRWFAIVLVAAIAGYGLLDAMEWARSIGANDGRFVVSQWLSGAWKGTLPDTPMDLLVLAVVVTSLLVLGVCLSYADRAAGYLDSSRPTLRVRGERGLPFVVATELAQWVRDPAARISLACCLLADAGVIYGVRSEAVDPGVAVVLLVLLSASGAELLIGRMLDKNWFLLAAGISEGRVLALRVVPVSVTMFLLFVSTFLLAGLLAGGWAIFGEACSLFLTVFACALLAGSLLPFDPRAPLSMIATTGLAILLEIGALVFGTAILQLAGWKLMTFDVFTAAIAVVLAATMFRITSRRQV